MDIAEIGRKHFADAFTKDPKYCEVTEWPDEEGKPMKIYWYPLSGVQQKQIEEPDSVVARTCMSVKVRALDADGKPAFENTPLVSLMHDYDYSVIRLISFLMSMDLDAEEADLEETDDENIEKSDYQVKLEKFARNGPASETPDVS